MRDLVQQPVKRTLGTIRVGQWISAIGSLAGLSTMAGLLYSCQFAGPKLSIHARDNGVRIQGRFLGEYDLGFERVRINQTTTGHVVCEVVGTAKADLHLIAGTNTREMMFGPAATVEFRSGSESCSLAKGQTYAVTIWGNNGWGNVRASSLRVQF